jgi:hypothetical protein
MKGAEPPTSSTRIDQINRMFKKKKDGPDNFHPAHPGYPCKNRNINR